MILAARRIVGDVDYDLIKIALDGKKLSFMRYPDFDDTPHPELAYSVRVFLPTASYGIKNYSNSENPLILHRKESFVDPSILATQSLPNSQPRRRSWVCCHDQTSES